MRDHPRDDAPAFYSDIRQKPAPAGCHPAPVRPQQPDEQGRVDITLAQIKESIGHSQFEAAWLEGSQLSLDEAVDLGCRLVAMHQDGAAVNEKKRSTSRE
jgi:hypothetical protein